jgi:hypothetical protein
MSKDSLNDKIKKNDKKGRDTKNPSNFKMKSRSILGKDMRKKKIGDCAKSRLVLGDRTDSSRRIKEFIKEDKKE